LPHQDEEVFHLGIGRALFANGQYREAIAQLGQVIGKSQSLAQRDWRTELVFSLLAHVQSRDAYQSLKMWLEEQQARAATGGQFQAELDAQAAIFWLVRDRYWALYRTPRDKTAPVVEATGRVGVSALTLVIDRETLLKQDSKQIQKRIHQVQRKIKDETGFLVPTPFIHGDPTLRKGAYKVLVNESPVAPVPGPGQIVAGARYCPDGGRCRQLGLRGTPDGGGVWLLGKALQRASQAGLVLEEPYGVLLERVVRRRLASFVGIQEVQALVDDWARDHPDNRLPGEITAGGVPVRFVRVLRGLAAEQVSVAQLDLVGQVFVAAGMEVPVREVVERVRLRLVPTLLRSRPPPRLLGLSEAFEASLEDCLAGPANQPLLAMKPAEAAAMIDAVRARSGDNLVLVVRRPGLRVHVRRLLTAKLPDLPVFSAAEVADHHGGSTPDTEVEMPVAAGGH
jgi:flagellar biosynthesis component FlhA